MAKYAVALVLALTAYQVWQTRNVTAPGYGDIKVWNVIAHKVGL